jgi:hypothetical protein
MSETLRALPNRESVGERVQRLQQEARKAALDHTADLLRAMAALAELADDIANGGDAYPAGVRDVARHLVNDLSGRSQTLGAIKDRLR